MGFEGGLLAAGDIDDMGRRYRVGLARSSLTCVVARVAKVFPGRPDFVMAGARDRDSRRLRAIAIYLGHTQLQLAEQVCAWAFDLHKSQATRAVQAIETERQEDPEFNAQLEQLEAVIRRWLMAARTIGPVPPTQGLVKRPVSVSRFDTGGAEPVADISSRRRA